MTKQNNKVLVLKICKHVTIRLFFSIELAILGCNASEESMQAVMNVFKDIRFKLNLAANPPVKNLAPLQVKQYLKENSLRFCVLVVDAETVNDGYGKLPKRKGEYEELLWTAADEVGTIEFFLQMKEKEFASLIV